MRFFRQHKFQILKGIYYFSVFFLASGFSYVAFANPPGSAYAPGATLDPSCAPGSTNCTVSSTATADGSDGYLQFNTSGSLASDAGLFWDNATKRLGIGTSTPSAPLTVVGQVLAGYFTGTSTATSTFGGNLAINGTGTSTSNGGFDITAGCYAVNGTCIGAGVSTNSAGGTGAIQFANSTAFAGDATNLFWDDSANRLGIGTSTPAYSLDVNGDANIAAGSAYRYNSVSVITASTTLGNYFFGGDAGNMTMTGSVNTGSGYQALYSNITGSQNTAFGYRSLYTSTSTNNLTAVGWMALSANTSGVDNTANGSNALAANTTGGYNTAVGAETLQANTTGGQNSAFGVGALRTNTTGIGNTGIGYRALRVNSSGHDNTANGATALSNNTTGGSNVANGAFALGGNSTGSGNVAMGYQSLYVATSTSYNTAIGYRSGYGALADNRSIVDTYATFLGYSASRDASVSSTTALTNITAIGKNATVAQSNSLVLGGTGADAVNVGIGTTTPSSSFTLTGRAGVNPLLIASSTGDTLLSILQNGNVGVGVATPTARFTLKGSGTGTGYSLIATDSNNSTHMVLTDSGLLGIGSGLATPLTRMQVGASNSITSTPSQLYFGEYSNTAGRPIFLGNWVSPGVWAFGPNSSATDSVLRIGVTASLNSNWDANQSAFKIAVGNSIFGSSVGIGTTTPGSLLTIAGGAIDLTATSTEGITGSEMITAVNDRDFSSANNWSGTNWSVGSGVGNHTAGNNSYSLPNTSLSAAPIVGNYYQITFTLQTMATGTPGLSVSFGGTASPVVYGVNSAPEYISGQVVVVRAVNSGALTFSPNNSTWTGYIDGVSVKQITPSALAQTIRNSDGTVGVEMRAGGTGLYNTFIGKDSGLLNTTGSGNNSNGYQALMSNVSGAGNIANGYQSLMNNTRGTGNIANGYQSLMSNLSGTGNIASGYQALVSNTLGARNTAIGYQSGYTNIEGSNNSFIGYQSGYSNTYGSNNSFFGYQAGRYNTIGSNNFYVGGGAGEVSDGNNNTFLGSYAGRYNGRASGNTYIGNYSGSGSMMSVGTASNNIFIGDSSGLAISSGSNNLAFGVNAGGNNADGSGNIFLGYQAASSTTVGDNNIAIGYSAQLASTTASNQLNIGSFIYGTGLGTSTISTIGKIGIGTTTPNQTLNVEQTTAGVVARFANSTGYCDINPTTTALVCTSDATLKKNVTTIGGALDAITSLRGVNFKWLSEDDSTHTHLGVIAQEVEQILPELVATDATTGKKSVNYIGFVPVLIEAVKDLASRVSNLEARIAQGVSDGISSISDFVVNTLTAKKVTTDTLEMKDSATGETYCVKIVSGEWDKSKGACASAPVNTETASVIEAIVIPVENASSTPLQEEVASSTPDIVEEPTPVPQPEVSQEESQDEIPAQDPVLADDTPIEPQP